MECFKWNMSIVGPRPCLLNQKTYKRKKENGVFKVKPGITGLAQINGITMSSPKLLAYTIKNDKKMNMFNYYYYIAKTFLLILEKIK